MSKRDNHWYILDTVVKVLGRRQMPRGAALGLWLLLFAGFVGAWRAGWLGWLQDVPSSPSASLGFALAVGLGFFALSLVLMRIRQAGFRTRYAQALAAPTPEPLIGLLAQAAAGMRALPDGDALAAHERAFAYALYGAGFEATRSLAGIAWESRAPLIRGIGLSAESLVELLCHRDARRALELARQARALATVSAAVPGSSQSERYHNTCVAVAEVILDVGISTSVARLEESAADDRFPALQLLATLGLAVAMERAGNTARAGELRAFIQKTAPHCAPLHLKAEDFTAESASVRPLLPVAPAVPSPTEDTHALAAKRRVLRSVGTLVGVWAVLLILYVLMYSAFSQPK